MRRVTTPTTASGGAPQDREPGSSAAGNETNVFTLSPLVAQGLAAAAGPLSERAVQNEVELDPTRCKWVYRDGTQCGRKLPVKEPGKQGNSVDYCKQRHEPGHEAEGRGLHDASNWWAEKARRAKGIGVATPTDSGFDPVTSPRPVTGGITWLSEAITEYRGDVTKLLTELLGLHGKYKELLDFVPALADPDAARAEVGDREKEFRDKLSKAMENASEADRLRLAAERAREAMLAEKQAAEHAAFTIAEESLAEQQRAEQAVAEMEATKTAAAEQVRAANAAAAAAKEEADERVRQLQAQMETAIGEARNAATEAKSDAQRRIDGANQERDREVSQARERAATEIKVATDRAMKEIDEARDAAQSQIAVIKQTTAAQLEAAAAKVAAAEAKAAAAQAVAEAEQTKAEANLARAKNAENNAARDAEDHRRALARLEEQHLRRIRDLHQALGWDENGEPIDSDQPADNPDQAGPDGGRP